MTTLLGPASLLLLLLTLGYLGTCATWPFAACRRCSGAGKVKSRLGRMYRHCRHCDGTGLRLRLGRRLWSAARRLHRESTR